jgi:hypothetical protein
MQARRISLSARLGQLLLAAVMLAAAPALQAGDGSSRAAMADAMARMMEAMGFLDGGGRDKGGGMPFDPSSMSMPGMTPSLMPGMGQFGQNPFGFNPWMSGFANPAQGFDMERMWQQMPGVSSMPESMSRFAPQVPGMPGWQGTTLEGIWEGRDGGLLIVQAYRFRLYSPHGGYVDGLIQQRGERIALYDPSSDTARPYEYAEHQGRLVLRDAEGQVYLYRRLWLDDGGDYEDSMPQRR